MKRSKQITSLLIAAIFILFTSIACNEENSLTLPEEEVNSDQAALEKIVEADEAIESFEPNYNEDDAMSFVLGKTATEIFPVRIGQKMRLVEKDLNIVFEGDSAYGTLTKTFDGILFIVASEDSLSLDSLDLNVYEKPFTTTITRKLIFVKVDNSDNPLNNWKISSVSLAEGGTLTDNIAIKSMTVFLPNGESIFIEEPNEYFLSRGPSLRTAVPILSKFETVSVQVELQSVYEDADFVTLTYGALKNRNMKRAKKRFELKREDFDGTFYNRLYEADYQIHSERGFRHAIVNAYPYQVYKDSDAPVESNSWGIPYFVH
ncbi:MAG: hypothetical protein GY936_01600 [Ignavibacteriae bacterium]|nr:hypothetical protein [Ignavibacteriota bacterium]